METIMTVTEFSSPNVNSDRKEPNDDHTLTSTLNKREYFKDNVKLLVPRKLIF